MQEIRLSIKNTIRKGVLGILGLSLAVSCNQQSCLSAAGGSDETAGVTDNEILIGSCCVLTGPAAQLGIQQLCGAKAYIDFINDKGGVNGRKIVLKEYDDKYEPQQAIDCFKQLVSDKCFAAAFLVGTPTGAKYVPMAETNGIPLIGMFTGAQILREPVHPHVFHLRASYFEETAAQIDHLFKDCGPKKVGIIYQDDAFGTAVLNGYKMALKKYGTEPVSLGSFKRNSVDVDDAIKVVRAGHPDFVGVVGQYTSVAAIVKRSHAEGFKPLFGTVSFIGTNAFIKEAGKDAEGVVISQIVPPYDRGKLPTIANYTTLLHKYFPDQKPGFSSEEGFLDAMVLVEGLQRAGKDLTRAKFMLALESIHDMNLGLGPESKLTYGPNRHTGLDTIYMTVVRSGHAVEFTDWKQLLLKH